MKKYKAPVGKYAIVACEKGIKWLHKEVFQNLTDARKAAQEKQKTLHKSSMVTITVIDEKGKIVN